MTVLRSVMIAIALGGGLLSCTARNPAYQVGSGPDAGEEEADTGPMMRLRDAGADSGTSSTTPACGKAQPPLGDLVAVDSLAIDKVGNIYFSNDDGARAWIGKLTPRATSANKQWLSIPAGLPTRGMAIDDANGLIYFTAGMAPAELQVSSLATAAAPTTVYKGFIDPNDAVMGPDGNVYVSDQGDGQIYSVDPATKKRTKVTTMPIGIASSGSGPAGLAFAPDHTLVVGYKGGGQLIRLSLTGGTEARRATFGPINDWVNGLAYDERGRLYLSLFDLNALRDVVRLDNDDAPPVPVGMGGHFSSMAFGRGDLNCTDLYVADPGAGMVVRRLPTDSAGLSSP